MGSEAREIPTPEVIFMCNNNNNLCNCIGNNWWWIIILLLIFCNCGGGNTCGMERCDTNCGCC